LLSARVRSAGFWPFETEQARMSPSSSRNSMVNPGFDKLQAMSFLLQP